MERLIKLDDITLLPGAYNPGELGDVDVFVREPSDVSVRSSLPIFTSPLSSLIGSKNWEFWQSLGIRTVIPSLEPLEDRLSLCRYVFCAFTLEEVEKCFVDGTLDGNTQYRVAIDTMNGQDTRCMMIGGKVKSQWGQQVLVMGGPISNPVSYSHHAQLGFDFVRVGTSEVCRGKYGSHAFGYPLGSLLDSIDKLKRTLTSKDLPKIIAEGEELGSIQNMIKALALGADYVMPGRCLSRIIETSSPIFQRDLQDECGERGGSQELCPVSVDDVDIRLLGERARNNDWVRYCYTNDEIFERISDSNYRSISEWSRTGRKDSAFFHGLRMVHVDRTLDEWVDEFISALKYAFLMYCASDWSEFKKNSVYASI